MKHLLLALLVAVPTLSHAQIFSIRRTSSPSTGNATLDGQLNAAIDTELLKVQNEINSDLPAGDTDRLMEGMANSQAAAGKGASTDYISHFDTFMVGAGVGVGADLEENKEYDSDLAGIGVMGSVQVGLNMSAIFDNKVFGLDPKKTTVVANFFSYSADQDFDESNAKIKMTSFGAHGSYKWKEGSGNRLFGWDGVRLHTGYQYSSASYDFKTAINENINETTSVGTITGNILANPAASIDVSSHSIPLEISSGVNFLWVLSAYGGVGTDINFGSAKGKANLNSDTTQVTCSGVDCGAAQGQQVDVETTANVDGKANVNPFFLRGFVGLQANLPYVRVFVHANKVFGTELYSFATGLRLAF